MNDDYKRMYMYICMALTFIFEHVYNIKKRHKKCQKGCSYTITNDKKNFYMKINKKKRHTKKIQRQLLIIYETVLVFGEVNSPHVCITEVSSKKNINK